ncbi:MAG: hypothetical protein C0498_01360 [Anaerolinea sp.]|nr:hypothetical protein [Anaerolinea sp.]
MDAVVVLPRLYRTRALRSVEADRRSARVTPESVVVIVVCAVAPDVASVPEVAPLLRPWMPSTRPVIAAVAPIRQNIRTAVIVAPSGMSDAARSGKPKSPERVVFFVLDAIVA